MLSMPKAHWTQGLEFVYQVISKVEMKTSYKDKLRYGVNTLGPFGMT